MITINMKKPIQCVSCPLWSVTTIRKKLYDVCRLEHSVIENPYTLPDWCQINELPPHGDLIDRDALTKRLEELLKYCTSDGHTAQRTREMIVELAVAPTIIPADESKEET